MYNGYILRQYVVWMLSQSETNPDSKVHVTNIGPIWGRQDPGGTHVGPMNFAIWEDKELWSCDSAVSVK